MPSSGVYRKKIAAKAHAVKEQILKTFNAHATKMKASADKERKTKPTLYPPTRDEYLKERGY